MTVVSARGLQRERTITDPRGVCDPKVRCSLEGETGETQVSTTPPPPPSPRSNWTRLVLPPVLSGHVSSFTPY